MHYSQPANHSQFQLNFRQEQSNYVDAAISQTPRDGDINSRSWQTTSQQSGLQPATSANLSRTCGTQAPNSTAYLQGLNQWQASNASSVAQSVHSAFYYNRPWSHFYRHEQTYSTGHNYMYPLPAYFGHSNYPANGAYASIPRGYSSQFTPYSQAFCKLTENALPATGLPTTTTQSLAAQSNNSSGISASASIPQVTHPSSIIYDNYSGKTVDLSLTSKSMLLPHTNNIDVIVSGQCQKNNFQAKLTQNYSVETETNSQFFQNSSASPEIELVTMADNDTPVIRTNNTELLSGASSVPASAVHSSTRTKETSYFSSVTSHNAGAVAVHENLFSRAGRLLPVIEAAVTIQNSQKTCMCSRNPTICPLHDVLQTSTKSPQKTCMCSRNPTTCPLHDVMQVSTKSPISSSLKTATKILSERLESDFENNYLGSLKSDVEIMRCMYLDTGSNRAQIDCSIAKKTSSELVKLQAPVDNTLSLHNISFSDSTIPRNMHISTDKTTNDTSHIPSINIATCGQEYLDDDDCLRYVDQMCFVCKRMFNNSSSLKDHLLEHTRRQVDNAKSRDDTTLKDLDSNKKTTSEVVRKLKDFLRENDNDQKTAETHPYCFSRHKRKLQVSIASDNSETVLSTPVDLRVISKFSEGRGNCDATDFNHIGHLKSFINAFQNFNNTKTNFEKVSQDSIQLESRRQITGLCCSYKENIPMSVPSKQLHGTCRLDINTSLLPNLPEFISVDTSTASSTEITSSPKSLSDHVCYQEKSNESCAGLAEHWKRDQSLILLSDQCAYTNQCAKEEMRNADFDRDNLKENSDSPHLQVETVTKSDGIERNPNSPAKKCLKRQHFEVGDKIPQRKRKCSGPLSSYCINCKEGCPVADEVVNASGRLRNSETLPKIGKYLLVVLERCAVKSGSYKDQTGEDSRQANNTYSSSEEDVGTNLHTDKPEELAIDVTDDSDSAEGTSTCTSLRLGSESRTSKNSGDIKLLTDESDSDIYYCAHCLSIFISKHVYEQHECLQHSMSEDDCETDEEEEGFSGAKSHQRSNSKIRPMHELQRLKVTNKSLHSVYSKEQKSNMSFRKSTRKSFPRKDFSLFNCEHCHQTFSSRGGLLYHWRHFHFRH